MNARVSPENLTEKTWRRRESKPFEGSSPAPRGLDHGQSQASKPAVVVQDRRRFQRVPVVGPAAELVFEGCVAETTGRLIKLFAWFYASGRRCTCQQCMALMTTSLVAWAPGCGCEHCQRGRASAQVSRRAHWFCTPELLSIDCVAR